MGEIILLETVRNAINDSMPVVALESAVITHGLPKPTNIKTAAAMEETVRINGATAATICLLDGKIFVGINKMQLETLGNSKNAIKVSTRDIAGAILKNKNGGTTVSGTMIIAHKVGIKIFATGGVGGVHRGSRFDISADLPTLSSTPMIVVCSGAKSILDLRATKEFLETSGVPVIGYQTDELPAFYSSASGIPVDFRIDNSRDIAKFAATHWSLGLKSAVLLVVPPPSDMALESELMEEKIDEAVKSAESEGIVGAKITPYLLKKISETTQSKSLRANTALLINNAEIAAKIAVSFAKL